ncbi:50S ribosomal protein L21 [Asticcacaulis sp. AC402]|uniref:50S ribosomal protein L21 n=1 Tax=Asticcacaulis sp. AC402 TaxID=1282361 RepID=UPI0003C3B76B|nr:50S ribosomal protein L21 [Asticcacaulis sp. AC402]ESQ77295.1 50S ribosomal protein L21 [Asticcacaulis sp. AC402]
MYAVIKTGGKQYRVAAGDLIKVEKLEGEPGAAVKFNEVLMVGAGNETLVGAPLVDGAVVEATLIETRKGDKVRIFKKTRRQGYRRTNGHRQFETVLRVTSILGGGNEIKWDGTVSLITKAELDARARGLAPRSLAAALETEVELDTAPLVETMVDEPSVIEDAPKKKAAPKKAAAETETTADEA